MAARDSAAHFAEVFGRGKADAALAASIFHFGVTDSRSQKPVLLQAVISARLPSLNVLYSEPSLHKATAGKKERARLDIACESDPTIRQLRLCQIRLRGDCLAAFTVRGRG